MTEQNYWKPGVAGRRLSRRTALRAGGIGLAGLAGAALIGCGDDSSTPAPGGTSTPGGSPAPGGTGTPAAQTPTGRVTVGLHSLGDQVWDPPRTQPSLAGIYAHAHYGEGLVIMGPEINKYVGGAAESWELPGDDGLTWVFNVRQGMKFHDGTELTPEDVGFTIEQFLDPEVSPTAGAILQRQLESFEVGDQTVTFHWQTPQLVGPTLAGMYIVPQAAATAAGDSFGDQPIGLGPFKFVEARRDQYAQLEAFEEHYRKVPGFKELRLQMIPDLSTRASALRTGEIDVMLKPSGPAIPDIENNPDLTLLELASTSLNGAAFPDLGAESSKDTSPWTDVRMREAVSHAVDVQAIIDRLYFGKAVPAAIAGAVQGLPGIPRVEPRAYDPQRARDLISAAGHEGLEFPMYTYESGAQAGTVDTAQAVATYLMEVGFQTRVQPQEQVTFFENLRGETWAGQAAITIQVFGGRAEESWLAIVDPTSPQPNFANQEYADRVRRLYTLSGEEWEQESIALGQEFYDQILYVPMVSQNYPIGIGQRIASWDPRMRLGFELGMEYIELA